MIAILGALAREIVCLRQKMLVKESFQMQHWRISLGSCRNNDILLAQTGCGKQKALAAADFIVNNYPLRSVLSVGFAGGLDEGLEVGDIVLYSSVYCLEDQEIARDKSHPCDDSLLSLAIQAAQATSLKVICGNGLTVPRIVADSQTKRRWGKISSALAMDMESYWIAQVAGLKKVPFLSVRSVSDTVKEELPDFTRFTQSDCRWQVSKALLYFLTHPVKSLKLFELLSHSRRAGKSLGIFMQAFISRLGTLPEKEQ